MNEGEFTQLIVALENIADALREHPRIVVIAIPGDGVTQEMLQQIAEMMDEVMK